MAKQKDGNGCADPVTVAERNVSEARARLAANAKEDQERTQAVARLDEAMGANPDTKDAERMGAQARVHEARLRFLARERKALESAVRDAEAGLKQTKADAAQTEINRQAETLDRLNAEIITGLAALLDRIAEHERIITRRDLLANEHDLPTPGRMRFLFPGHLLRLDACKVLRNRLHMRHALGGIQQKPAETGPPLYAVPVT
jgi:hypothetical protein